MDAYFEVIGKDYSEHDNVKSCEIHKPANIHELMKVSDIDGKYDEQNSVNTYHRSLYNAYEQQTESKNDGYSTLRLVIIWCSVMLISWVGLNSNLRF